jgi:hypothetical protein
MFDPSHADEQGLRAAYEQLQRTLVFLIPGAPTRWAPEVASTTLLVTPAKKLVLLTAFHNVEDFPAVRYSGSYPGREGGIDDLVKAVHPHPRANRAFRPDDIDVALCEVADQAVAELADRAYSTDVVARADDHAVSEPPKNWCLMAGVPGELVRPVDVHERRIRYQAFAPLTHGAIVTGRGDRGRYHVAWDTAHASGQFAKVFPDLAAKEGVEFKLPDPGGMSGAALWRFAGAPASEPIWAAHKQGRIIGVDTSWDTDKTLFVESVEAWGDWFKETIATIDRG